MDRVVQKAKSKGAIITKVLKRDPATLSYCPKLKYWIKQRGFRLISHAALGLSDVLCLPAKEKV